MFACCVFGQKALKSFASTYEWIDW